MNNLAEFFNTIDRVSTAEFRDRGSLFVANASPVSTIDQFKKNLEGVKKLHPKATHHCFAYRLGLTKTLFRVNDDGEPAGTAGKPILGQIDSRELTDVLIIVTRYFGGSLLGVPGLINAYKMASSMALQTTPVVRKEIEIEYLLRFDYTKTNAVMKLIKQKNLRMIQQEMQLFCEMRIAVPVRLAAVALSELEAVPGMELRAV